MTGYRLERCANAGCSNFVQIATPPGTSYTDTGSRRNQLQLPRPRRRRRHQPRPLLQHQHHHHHAPVDTTPPAPTNLVAAATSASEVGLTWTAATDNTGVTGYRLERCPTPAAQLRPDRHPARHQLHRHRAQPQPATATASAPSTPPPTSAPTPTPAPPSPPPPRHHATHGADQPGRGRHQRQRGRPHLDRRHRQHRCDRLPARALPTSGPPPTTATPNHRPDRHPARHQLHRHRAHRRNQLQLPRPRRRRRHQPRPLLQHQHHHHPGPVDTTPPTAPTNLVAAAASASEVGLTWTAATDNTGVTGYRLERCATAGCSTSSRSPPRPAPATPTPGSPPQPATATASAPSTPPPTSAPTPTPAPPPPDPRQAWLRVWVRGRGGSQCRRCLRLGQQRPDRHRRLDKPGPLRQRTQLQRQQRPRHHRRRPLPPPQLGNDPRSLGLPNRHPRPMARRDLQRHDNYFLTAGSNRSRPSSAAPSPASTKMYSPLQHPTQQLDAPRRHLRRNHTPPLHQRHPGHEQAQTGALATSTNPSKSAATPSTANTSPAASTKSASTTPPAHNHNSKPT